MPKVPTPFAQGAAPVGDVQRAPLDTPFQNLQMPDTGFNARVVGEIGGSLGMFAQEAADRNTERKLLEIQSAFDDYEAELFDPQTGILTKLQGDAVGITKAVRESMEQFSEQWGTGEGLSHSGKMAVEQYLRTASERVTNRAEAHETTEDHKYRITQLDSIIEGLSDRVARDALGVETPEDLAENTAVFEASVAQMISVAYQLADSQGWSAEQIDTEIEIRTGRMVIARSLALAEDNPDMALQVLEDGQGLIDPDDYAQTHAAIEAAAKDHTAYNAAIQAVNVDHGGEAISSILVDEGVTYSTQFTYNLGPSRPYAPDAAIHHVLGQGAENILGKGARVEIFSGQEGENGQHGSPRHQTGGAADVRFYRPDGSLVKLADPEFYALAVEFAQRGALGLGAGTEYMGDAMHVDLVKPEGSLGQGNVWEDALSGNAEALQALMSSDTAIAAREALGVEAGGLVQNVAGAGGYTSPNTVTGSVQGPDGVLSELSAGAQLVMGIEDEETRKLAMNYFSSEQKFITTQRALGEAQMLDEIYTRIYESDAKVPLNDLITPTEIRRLGTNIQAVQSYYNSTAAGGVVTDWGVYIAQKELIRSDPAGFLKQFEDDPSLMINLRQQLGTTEFKEIQSTLDSLTAISATAGAAPEPFETFSLSEIKGYVDVNKYTLGLGKGVSNVEEEAVVNELIAQVQNAAERLAQNESRDLEATVDLPALVQRFLPEVTSDKRSFNEVTLVEALAIADDKFSTYEDMLEEELSIAGVAVDDDVAQSIAWAYEGEYGRAPLPSELLAHISRYLNYEAGGRGVYKSDILIPRYGPADIPPSSTPDALTLPDNDVQSLLDAADEELTSEIPSRDEWNAFISQYFSEEEVDGEQRFLLYRQWMNRRR